MSVLINSRLRTSGTSTSFKILIDKQIIIKKYAKLEWLCFANNSYTVNQSNCNLDYYEGSTLKSISLTNGYYAPGDFVTLLQNSLNSNSSGTNYTVSLNALTSFLTVSASSGNIQFLFGSGKNKLTSPYILMGFTQNDTNTASSLTGNSAIYLNSPDYLVIDIEKLDGKIYSADNQHGTFVIPVTTKQQNVDFYFSNTHFDNYIKVGTPVELHGLININIYSDDGKPFNNNGSDFKFQFSYE